MDYLDKTYLKALFTSEYYKEYQAVEEYVEKITLSIFRKTGISSYLQQEYRTARDIISHFGFHFQSEPFLSWALKYLELRNHLHSLESRGHKMKTGLNDLGVEESRSRLLKCDPSAEIFVELIKRIELDIGVFFTGEKRGDEILFTGRDSLNLWNDYFNNGFQGYSVINSATAYGIAKWFSQGKPKSMLELGSGTSGGTIKVFQALLDNNLHRSIETILLTDIAPALLNLGEKNIKKQLKMPPGYEQEVLDINSHFKKQLKRGRFDIVYGINVLHAAKDLGFTLKEIYDHLDRNGMVIMGESVRPYENRPMHSEILFNLLENYHSVRLDPESRPYHGYLTKERWIRHFEKAGFKDIDFLTEPEGHDQFDFDLKPLHSFLVLKGQK